MTSRGFRPSRELDMKQELQVPRVLGRGPNALALPADMNRLWMAHRCVSDAKKRYGLSNGAISTLRALISFLREGGETIVYAANATICKRADNQSERNLRRHLARLVEVGLIVRRDSPNGKRYVIQHPDGPVEAFGLDLSPLMWRSGELGQAAAEVNRESALVKFMRKRLSSLLYHAEQAGHVDLVDEYRPARRRRLSSEALSSICDKLQDVLDTERARAELVRPDASEEIPAAIDGHPVRHKINTEYKEKDPEAVSNVASPSLTEAELLQKIQDGCPEALSFAVRRPSSMWEVEEHALTLAAWCGISSELLSAAIAKAGRTKVAVAVLGLFGRRSSIRNLPAYFNSLFIGKRASGFQPFTLLT